MKDRKRILAILAVIAILIMFCLPMFFAFGSGEKAAANFRVSLGIALIGPILIYICLMFYRSFRKKDQTVPSGIRNVVFDVGDVLQDFTWDAYLDSFGFPEEEKKILTEAIIKNPVWNERDKGEHPEEYYTEQFAAAAPGYEEDVRKVLATVYDTIHNQEYADSWTGYLKERGYHLFVLSNTCEHILNNQKPKMTFLRNMDGALFSCEEKMTKPDPAFFGLLLQRYGLKAEECVFIDDREDNCAAARSIGMKAVRFESFRQAAEELEKLGVA